VRHASECIVITVALLQTGPVCATVVEFTDKDEWGASVGSITSISFIGFPEDTVITDQYGDDGVLFTDGNDTVLLSDWFLQDGAGLYGNGDIYLGFLTPQAYIAVDFPFSLRISLFSQGQLIYSSDDFGTPGPGDFVGLISSQSFDSAIVSPPLAAFSVHVDDLHFGVPAPSSLAALGLGGLFPRRRRQ